MPPPTTPTAKLLNAALSIERELPPDADARQLTRILAKTAIELIIALLVEGVLPKLEEPD